MPQFALIALLALASGWIAGNRHSEAPLGLDGQMRTAAIEWLDTLSEDLRKQAHFPMDHAERRAWSNLPKTMVEREGVPFGEMNDKQRAAAHRLLRTMLSNGGYHQVTGIMRLDDVLRDMVKVDNPTAALRYSHDYYWLAVFGNPRGPQSPDAVGKEGGDPSAWGIQLDGHHLALNITVIGDRISVTPTFLGGNPIEIPSGPYAGWRVLEPMDELGQQLLNSLSKEQRQRAIIATKSPGDVLAGPGKATAIGDPEGIHSGDLNDKQQRLLRQLAASYFRTYAADVAKAAINDFNADLNDGVHFAWLGGSTDKPYAYRIHGKRNWIEFSNVAGAGTDVVGMNHIHSIWRNMEADFGEAPAIK